MYLKETVSNYCKELSVSEDDHLVCGAWVSFFVIVTHSMQYVSYMNREENACERAMMGEVRCEINEKQHEIVEGFGGRG